MTSGDGETRLRSRSARRRSGRRRGERRPAAVTPEAAAERAEQALDARAEQFVRGRFGAEASTVTIAPLSGDASTRRYFRLQHASGSAVIALHPEPFAPGELSFVIVRQLMAGWGLPVPEILDAHGPLGVLMLQDLGDLSLQEALRDANPGRRTELYRQALDQLVVLQRESVRASQRASCFQIAFDFEKLSWELHFFWKHFLEGYRRCDLSVEDRMMVADGFHRLCAEIASWPRVLCHRDFHSRNLMCHEGALYWIDFQDARMGPATYDLSSLLRDSYVELEEELIADLAEEFRQRAVPGEARDAFQRRLELMSIQRNLKALGTFGYMYTVRHNRVYLPYIPRTLANARRNLTRHPELAGLRKALASHLEELS